jgi:radical SAM superfamily enzyme YgiQ (UPF0313 family)
MINSICLIHPPMPDVVDPCTYPPLGIGYLCAAVRNAFPDLKCDALDLTGHAFADAVEVALGYDVVGYSATSTEWKNALTVASGVYAKDKTKIQIAGGAHTTLTGETSPLFDATFRGPAEETLVEYLNDLVGSRPRKGVYVGECNDLNKLAFPIVGPGKRINMGGADRTAVMITSRGCTNNCVFCACRGMYRRIRLRSLDNIFSEIDQWRDKGIGEFRFVDDSFGMSKARLLEFCGRAKGRGMRWGCMIRVDQVSQDVLATMKDSGCGHIGFGVESFDDNVLTVLEKNSTSEMNSKAVRAAHDAGLAVQMYMLISTPGETYDVTVDRNIEAMDALLGAYDKVLFSTFMPHPGTAVHANPRKYGIRIVETDYSKYTQHQYEKTGDAVVLKPPWSPILIDGMTYEQQLSNISRFREYVANTNKIFPGRYS